MKQCYICKEYYIEDNNEKRNEPKIQQIQIKGEDKKPVCFKCGNILSVVYKIIKET